jgi:hypothetical protein
LITLGAVLLGGLMTMLGQLTLESIRSRLAARQLRREREAAVRVIRFQFYCAQHVVKRALESRVWWGTPDELTLGEPGEDLRILAGLLPELEWRIYTSAWRRLRECSQLRSESAAAPGLPDEDGVDRNGHDNRISVAALQQLLGAFVTVDDARHRLESYVVDKSTGEIPLHPIGLTPAEIAFGLQHHVGHLVDTSGWPARLGIAEVR